MKEKIYSLLRDSDFRKYFANTSWLMAEKTISLLISLIVSIYVARYLGPSEFGILQYSISFVAIFGAFSKLGLDNIIIKFLVQYPERQNEYIGTALILRIFGGIILLIIVFIISSLIETRKEILLITIISISYLFQSSQVFEFFFRAKVLEKVITKIYIFGIVFVSIIKLLLIFFSASLIFFAYVYVIHWLINTILFIMFYIKKGNRLKELKFNFIYAKALISESWPLIITMSINMIYMKIDQIMIKQILGEFYVGQYAVAAKISDSFNLFGAAISSSLFPIIVKTKIVGEKIFLNRIGKLYSLLIWFSIFNAILFTFFRRYIIIFLFGTEYYYAIDVLMIHIWTTIFFSIGMIVSKVYIVEGIQKLSIIRSIIAASMNIILNLILISKYGILGAAISTLVSHVFGAYLMNLLFTKSRNQFFIITRAFIFNFTKS